MAGPNHSDGISNAESASRKRCQIYWGVGATSWHDDGRRESPAAAAGDDSVSPSEMSYYDAGASGKEASEWWPNYSITITFVCQADAYSQAVIKKETQFPPNEPAQVITDYAQGFFHDDDAFLTNHLGLRIPVDPEPFTVSQVASWLTNCHNDDGVTNPIYLIRPGRAHLVAQFYRANPMVELSSLGEGAAIPDQLVVGSIHDEDPVFRPYQHVNGEIAEVCRRSYFRCVPTYGNCPHCYSSGPLGCICWPCNKSNRIGESSKITDFMYSAMLFMPPLINVILDARQLSSALGAEHHDARADRIEMWDLHHSHGDCPPAEFYFHPRKFLECKDAYRQKVRDVAVNYGISLAKLEEMETLKRPH